MSFLDLQDESSAEEMKKRTKEMKVRVVKVIQYAIRSWSVQLRLDH